jgi:hypothetical protein
MTVQSSYPFVKLFLLSVIYDHTYLQKSSSLDNDDDTYETHYYFYLLNYNSLAWGNAKTIKFQGPGIVN